MMRAHVTLEERLAALACLVSGWQTASLDSLDAGGGDEHVEYPSIRQLADPAQSRELTMVRDSVIGTVSDAIDGLPHRDRAVLALRFGLDGGSELTFRQVGEALQLSGEWVRKIEASALRQLRQRLAVGA